MIDGRSARRAPQAAIEQVAGPVLWVDPLTEQKSSIYRPLELDTVLALLDAQHANEHHGDEEEPIKVLIADPYQLFRQALKRCLEDRPEVSVVGEVRSPREYRQAKSEVDYQVAIVASDLFEGTHSTAPLRADDWLLRDNETEAEDHKGRPTIVLVADEDLEEVRMRHEARKEPGASPRVYIHRGAPAETIIDAMKQMLNEQVSQRI